MMDIIDKPKADNLSRRIAIHLGTWLLLTIIVATILAINTLLTYQSFLQHGAQTVGRVIAKEPENHQFIRYSYTVGQQTYTGLWGAGCGTPRFEALKVNDSVLVTYDANDPKSSLLGNAECWAKGDLPAIIGASIILPLLIMGVLMATGKLPR